MSDLVLGMIIGGLIGVVGSTVTAWIHGRYSLITRREDNSARERQQSAQIEHENTTAVISRIIRIRSVYLEPLCEHLGELHTCIDVLEARLTDLLASRCDREFEVRVPQEDRTGFSKALDETNASMSAIESSEREIYRRTSRITDDDLQRQLRELITKVCEFTMAYQEMRIGFYRSTRGEDFTYDCGTIIYRGALCVACIRKINARIEILLAGGEINGL